MVKTVDVPVETVVPLPRALTDPLALPPPLGDSITVEDLVEQLYATYRIIQQCNADRSSAAHISEGHAQ